MSALLQGWFWHDVLDIIGCEYLGLMLYLLFAATDALAEWFVGTTLEGDD